MADVDIQGSSFDLSYRRTTYQPIDSSSVFKTKGEATVYALNNSPTKAYVPYAGQIISVLEDESVYKLVKAKNVKEVEERKGKPHFDLELIGSTNNNDDRYLRKDQAETMPFPMTFEKGINVTGGATADNIKVSGNVVSNDFTNGSTGFGIYRDEKGDYHLSIPYVNILKKLTVDEIQVQQSSYIGGKQWNTAAGMICSAVEDKGTYWRCYFKTTDAEGRTVRNTFAKDDQAICETFNLDKQASGTLGNHYYWRLVVNEPGNDYIDLSKSDCDTGSDAPEVGDNIVQLGNRTDTSRQGAICWDSVTDGGPYVRVYKGINSYHLPQPNIDLNPEDSVIKAKLVSEATGKEIDETIGDMQVNLDLIKQQTDKEYTLWFYEYEPSLSNLPASEWTTAELKAMHDQDMFYNRLTGKGYRFEDGAWEPITDHLTLKALEDAAKAQDTADSKRRVFVAQPTAKDAYDVGDLWVNATYSDGTVTYKNDSLVCKTAKAAGAAFSIGHWKPSSTATTAYLENLGDRIIAAVTDSENGIAAAKELARQGINDAYDAAQSALSALGIAQSAQGTADQNTAAIQVTKDSIAALVEGIHLDSNGNITNIDTSGLVTTNDFNVLLSKKVNFDAAGHITNISTSGLVTESSFSQMFSERAEASGYVKRAEISTFVTKEETGWMISNAVISADQIRFNGNIVANDTSVVDENGNVTMNDITANNLTLSGNINGNNATLNDITLNNVTANSGTFMGTVTTSANGTRIEMNPSTNSLKMYNENDMEVGKMSFLNDTWNGSVNSYPQLVLRTYGGNEMTTEVSLANGRIVLWHMLQGDSYQCVISPSSGLSFSKNGVNTKNYSAS